MIALALPLLCILGIEVSLDLPRMSGTIGMKIIAPFSLDTHPFFFYNSSRQKVNPDPDHHLLTIFLGADCAVYRLGYPENRITS